MYTTEQKYKWLLSMLKVVNVDYYEQDAMLHMNTFFQFNKGDVLSVEGAIEMAMNDWFVISNSRKEQQ